MVLQNESVDEDIEHFEDIAEENDEGPYIESAQDVGNPGNKNDASEDEEERLLVSFNDDSKAKSESDFSEDEDENISQASSSEDDDSDEGDELLIEDNFHKSKGRHPLSDSRVTQPLLSHAASSLPGGYSPRHREPSFCNADRASWWELMVLASHVHPSVATMARTLLSGANIVYNGNPLNDLSLTAFLDKFMEKKPKQTTWHGGSQIEPAKKLDLNNHLIGPEILSLAEVDVPPEDLVFHKFYMNKTTISSKSKKKKKKKSVEDEAEEFFDADDADEAGGGDESDNEEIENMLDSTDVALEADGDYDYDDLDQVANEDDDDLIGNVSDTEMEVGSDILEDEDLATIDNDDEIDEENDVDDDAVDIGDVDDGSDDEDSSSGKRKGKRKKSGRNAGASPFASLEEYEHLLNEDNPTENKSPKTKKNNSESRKKRKSSK